MERVQAGRDAGRVLGEARYRELHYERLLEDLTEHSVLPGEQSRFQRAAGLMIGWYSRGVTDSEPETVANWETFSTTAPFWRP